MSKKKNSFYIATNIGNAKIAKQLGDALQAMGWTWTYDWTIHAPADQTRAKEFATAEKVGVTSASVLVALLPGGRGTHIEIGMAVALDKPVLLVAQSEKDWRKPYPCLFYSLATELVVNPAPCAKWLDSKMKEILKRK